MTRRGNQTHRRDARRERAQFRQEARDLRTDAQQLAKLRDDGHGHCTEAVRLQERIVAEATVEVPTRIERKREKGRRRDR